MSRTVVTLGLAFVLIMAVSTISETLSKSPAFNSTLRVENVYGSEQVPIVQSMYDYSDYLLQVGSSFTRADLLPTETTEGFDEFASIEVAIERSFQAVQVLEQSALIDPANALVWESLAWAYSMAGEAEAAQVALQHSWELAPYNVQLANLRLTLSAGLFIDEEIPELALNPSDEDRAAIARDLITIRELSPTDHEFHLENLAGAN